ncbi:hypothetical protein QAD02_001644 [Eretmocerus hayati]|uniref:Uncharacterized protein n=1 Tax=Eretmocerus hayati TaxID=131215 RepID=A0ACC2NGU7_9HYME|nr:hypothetical protein QAD02_001644 [Eretmocerus hayati]
MGGKWGSQGLDFDITIDPSPTTRNTTWMPLSVRGVGSAIAVTYSQLYFLRRTKKAKMCTVYQAFRACLAQVSLRLSNQLLGRPDTPLTGPTVSDIFLEPQLASFVESNPASFPIIHTETEMERRLKLLRDRCHGIYED